MLRARLEIIRADQVSVVLPFEFLLDINFTNEVKGK
jgi:hypothetical protein